MNTQFDKIEKKLEDISKKQGEMNVTLAKQSVILKEHVRRTNKLEDRVDDVESWRDKAIGIIKFIVIVAIVITAVAAIATLLVL